MTADRIPADIADLMPWQRDVLSKILSMPSGSRLTICRPRQHDRIPADVLERMLASIPEPEPVETVLDRHDAEPVGWPLQRKRGDEGT